MINDILDLLNCPITFDRFKAPTTTNSGQTYEYDQIAQLLDQKKNDPLTNDHLTCLISNRLVQQISVYFSANLSTQGENNISEEQKRELERLLTCPLSGRFLSEPVLIDSGITYDRRALEEHIQSYGRVDPQTKAPFEHIIKNYLIASVADKYLQANKEVNEKVSSPDMAQHINETSKSTLTTKPVVPEQKMNGRSSDFNAVSQVVPTLNHRNAPLEQRIQFVLKVIKHVFDEFDKNVGQNSDLGFFLLVFGATKNEALTQLISDRYPNMTTHQRAESIQEALRGLMWYQQFSQWNERSIQQILMSVLLRVIGKDNIVENEWGNKPKNTKNYWCLFSRQLTNYFEEKVSPDSGFSIKQ